MASRYLTGIKCALCWPVLRLPGALTDLYRSETRLRVLKCGFVRRGIGAWRHRVGHDPVVRVLDPVSVAAVDDRGGARGSGQRGGGAGAAASSRGPAPSRAATGLGTRRPGGTGRLVAAAAS